jgi:hypothetical protein
VTGNLRAVFVGEDEAEAQSEHDKKMRVYREQRASAMNILVGVIVFVLSILILVGGFCAAVLLVRAAF